jgi:glycerol-3-phosphate acyltransferase PlsY
MAFGYLLGTLPTARLITRWVSAKDVLEAGSGNAGAMNSYRVSGKKWVGIVVALVDIAKGFVAVKLAVWFLSNTFVAAATTGFFCALGHCYNVFQQGRGGRGLAPAAGVAIAINPVSFVVFCVTWLTGYGVIRRNIHVGTMTAALATPILLFNAPELLIKTFMQVPYETFTQHGMFVLLLCSLIVVRHLEPIRALLGGPGSDTPDDPEH